MTVSILICVLCCIVPCLAQSPPYVIRMADLNANTTLPDGDRIGLRDVTQQIEDQGGCMSRLQVGVRLILARETVTMWKALHLHELPAYEGDVPITEVAEVWTEKIELEGNQSPTMSIFRAGDLGMGEGDHWLGLWKERRRIGLPNVKELTYLIEDGHDVLENGKVYDLTWYVDNLDM